MRRIEARTVSEKVAELAVRANYFLPDDVLSALRRAEEQETSEDGRFVLAKLIENAELAAKEHLPLCQDTGVAVVFVTLGAEVVITGGSLPEAINEGVAKGCREGYLRASILADPLRRDRNTGDNTPAVIHIEIVPGDRLVIDFLVKGAGSENMSSVAMLAPAEGINGVKRFILSEVARKGASACPPLIIGVGIGGTMELASTLAKRALLRPIGKRSEDEAISALEEELLLLVNELGIGPLGLGGRTTALAVNIETHPCHIASLPVAVNLGCHSHRHQRVII
ncbi:MAG: fumarate hydratase [Acidobacteria bacterium]|nr:fumarate hydratase [Acidobacteriota bacterium]